MIKTPIAHGGALAEAARKYGGNKEDWLDLSTGINPVSAPLPKLDSPVWQALPDVDLMESCLSAARQFYGFHKSASLIAAPGVQALIQLCHIFGPAKRRQFLARPMANMPMFFNHLAAGVE
jgi:cobalamin biosynthesis protein CobC